MSDLLTELAKPEKLQSLGVGLFFWLWFFILAPARSFKAGVALEDPPFFFKVGPFKWIRILALLYPTVEIFIGRGGTASPR